MAAAATEVMVPVRISAAEAALWERARGEKPLLFRLTAAWARYAPKGKGWLPRRVGRGPLKHSRLVIRTSSGNHLAVEPRDLDYYTTILSRGGHVDRHVRDACVELTRPGNVFYDIGANSGYVGVEVAAAHGGTVRVLAFEPQPALAHVAAVSVALNKLGSSIEVYQLMLGVSDQDAELYVPTCGIHASAVSRESGATRIECPMMRIDTLVASRAMPPPDVMKVDVEGAELDVFKGAEATIREHRPTIVFESDANMQRFGYGRQELANLLCSFAPYVFYFATEQGRVRCGDRLMDPTYSDLVAISTR